MAHKQKASKADKKRKSAQNSRYKAEHRCEKNKMVRLRRHLKKHPKDSSAIESAKLTSAYLGKTFQMAA